MPTNTFFCSRAMCEDLNTSLRNSFDDTEKELGAKFHESDCTIPFGCTPRSSCSALFSASTRSLNESGTTIYSASLSRIAPAGQETITFGHDSVVYNTISDWQTDCLPGWNHVGSCKWRLVSPTASCPPGWTGLSTAFRRSNNGDLLSQVSILCSYNKYTRGGHGEEGEGNVEVLSH
jgi:hypothetical protein